MKKIVITGATLAAMAIPAIASAHAHASYLIGGVQYDIVIGSLNEPVVVDDKTGLDLRVTKGGHMATAADGDMEAAGGTPATGLESALKVEMIAGDVRKTFDLTPAYGAPGAYKTTFYPTVPTSFSYRLFGTINDTPVDLLFTCRPEGAQSADEGEKEISAGVKQLMKGGGFGCPSPKESFGFPEQSVAATNIVDRATSSRTFGIAGIALATIALALAARKK